MRPTDRARSVELDKGLQSFSLTVRPLPGVEVPAARICYVRQLIDSIHRVEYARRLGERLIDPRRQNPNDPMFDPIKGALLLKQQGETDEAAWLVFLATHFGPSRRHGWELTRRVYGALGSDVWWTWARVSANLTGFRDWFVQNEAHLQGVPFGNHRKYVTIRADAKDNLADTVESYCHWVGPNRGFELMLVDAAEGIELGPEGLFGVLYRTMRVAEFGRTGKFDYLAMLGKLGIAPIAPPSPFLSGATGPLTGARLMFGGGVKTATLDEDVVKLGNYLGVGMQEMEDSLCNWQKSPTHYLPFRG